MNLTRRSLSLAMIGLMAPKVPRAAETRALSAPTGKPILTLSGKIGVFNSGNVAEFDLAMLEDLGTGGFTTTTPWYNEPVVFAGIPMTTLMQVVHGFGETVVATALNDYETKIPISDFAEFNVLLALKRNGEYMPVRDKGPLFIVYPYDSDPVLKSQKYYSRSAWQLRRLIVV